MEPYVVIDLDQLIPVYDGIRMVGVIKGHPIVADTDTPSTTSRIVSFKWTKSRLLVTTRNRTYHVKGNVHLFQEVHPDYFKDVNEASDKRG